MGSALILGLLIGGLLGFVLCVGAYAIWKESCDTFFAGWKYVGRGRAYGMI